MKYNRAFIKRGSDECERILKHNDTGEEDDSYWLFESGESFHGEHDGKAFYFKDARLPSFSLPLKCVELEFNAEEEV